MACQILNKKIVCAQQLTGSRHVLPYIDEKYSFKKRFRGNFTLDSIWEGYRARIVPNNTPIERYEFSEWKLYHKIFLNCSEFSFFEFEKKSSKKPSDFWISVTFSIVNPIGFTIENVTEIQKSLGFLLDFFRTRKKYFSEELRKILGYSFHSENAYLSIGVLFGTIRAR